MPKLENISISAKVLLIVGLMGFTSVVIAVAGSWGLSRMAQNTQEVNLGGDKMRMGAHMGRNLVELNRAEYSIAADPSEISEYVRLIESARESFDTRLAEMLEVVDPQSRSDLQEAQRIYREYISGLESLVEQARRARNVELSTVQEQLLDRVRDNRELQAGARDRIMAVIERVDNEVDATAAEAQQEATRLLTTMISIAFFGIALGVGLGFMLARYGISRPMNEIIGGLNQLAENNLDIEVAGAERGDELGDIARAMQIFKDNAIERQRLEEAQRSDDETRVARAQTVEKLVGEFEDSAAEILRTLASAAEEMNATAASMASTAERTAEQSTATSAAAQ
jgi:methyl-accepting chemotaxis protein